MSASPAGPGSRRRPTRNAASLSEEYSCLTRISTVSVGRVARKSRQATRTSPNIRFWNDAPWWIANDPSISRHRTSRKRMPLVNCCAIVVFWHSDQGPPNRAPESCVPGIVKRWSAVRSGSAAIQSCVPRTARRPSRVAATAGAAPTTAVADTARAPARKPLREGRSGDTGVRAGMGMRVPPRSMGEPGSTGPSAPILSRARHTERGRGGPIPYRPRAQKPPLARPLGSPPSRLGATPVRTLEVGQADALATADDEATSRFSLPS
ncbi:hypothetical protein SCALM49S_02918 [Streptomyces californicus]